MYDNIEFDLLFEVLSKTADVDVHFICVAFET